MPKFTRDDIDFTIELPDKLTHGHITRYFEAFVAVRIEAAEAAKRSTTGGFPHEPNDVFNAAMLTAAIRCGWVHGLIEENISSLAPWVPTWASQCLLVLSHARRIPKVSSSPAPTSPKADEAATGSE